VEYCDPWQVDSIVQALATLLEDPNRRAALAERGRVRAASFSWERTAALVLEALERAAGR
jgi:glycosyltransferase involved in cell wall biosynthesis